MIPKFAHFGCAVSTSAPYSSRSMFLETIAMFYQNIKRTGLVFALLMMFFGSIVAQKTDVPDGQKPSTKGDIKMIYTDQPIEGVPLKKGQVAPIPASELEKEGTLPGSNGRISLPDINPASVSSTSSTGFAGTGHLLPDDLGLNDLSIGQVMPMEKRFYSVESIVESDFGSLSPESFDKSLLSGPSIQRIDNPEQGPTSGVSKFIVPLEDLEIQPDASGSYLLTYTGPYLIPDANWMWVQMHTGASIPSTAVITNFEYRLQISDTGDPGNFWAVDYEVWLSSETNGAPNRFLNVYDNLGETTDGGYDDDVEDDSDIYIDWRSTNAFNGEIAAQAFSVWISDTYTLGEGNLDYVEFNVHWTTREELPNLNFQFTPTGWDFPVIISSVTGTNTDDAGVTAGATSYLDFAFGNPTNVAIPSGTYVYAYIWVDGVYIDGYFWDGFAASSFGIVEDIPIVFDDLNSIVELCVDEDNYVPEINESDNCYTRQVQSSSLLPNLIAGYTPAGWDWPIVVSSVAGTHTDGPDLQPGVTSYIDFAFVNRYAEIPAGNDIYLYLYVDGSYVDGWVWDGIGKDYYAYFSDVEYVFSDVNTDIAIYVDATENIEEYNELDNYYSRRLGDPPLPNLIADYTPSGWDAPIVVSSVEGTSTDGPNLIEGQISYIDFAFLNRDADVPEGYRIYNYIFIDGTLTYGYYWLGIQENYYGFVQDIAHAFDLGTHAVSTQVDAEGNVYESDENDNIYSRDLTWVEGIPDISVDSLSLTIDEPTEPLAKEETLDTKSAIPGQQYTLKPHTGVDKRLQDEMETKSANGLLPVVIDLDKKLNPGYFAQLSAQMGKKEKTRTVASELKQLAALEQSEIMEFLQFRSSEGKVGEIVELWATNSIGVELDPSVVDELMMFGNIASIWLDDVESQVFSDNGDDNNAPSALVGSLEQVNADDVWGLGITGVNVVVGVIDTGVNYDHTDLTDHMWDGGATYPHHGYDFIDNDNDPMDEHGHGTHVSGTVAGDGTSGTSTGVAPDATILAVRAVPGSFTITSQAVQFCIDAQVDVISMSAGWGYYDNSCNYDDISDELRTSLRDVGNSLLSAGIPWIVAAGNDADCPGAEAPLLMNAPADVPSPWYGAGGHSSVISVAAITSSNEWATFSNFGPVEWDIPPTYNDYPAGNSLIKPNIAAPGVNITSLAHYSNTDYESGWSGTSMATPHVSGVVALMLQKNPTLSPAQIDEILHLNSTDLGDPGMDNLFGAGLLDALAAVNAVPGDINYNFVIRNLGTGTLMINSISSNAGWLTTSDHPTSAFDLAPGAVEVVFVNVNWSLISGTEVGQITVSSDDPDSPNVVVDVTAISGPGNNPPEVVAPLNDEALFEGFGTHDIDISGVFSDPDGDPLTYTAVSGIETVVTASVSGTTLTLSEVGPGISTITVTADDGEFTVDNLFNFEVITYSCSLPFEWTVNPSDFAYNGQFTARVLIDDVAVDQGFLAAFVGSECRGVTEASLFPPSGQYVFELMCYSNQASGEVLIFKYMDNVSCEILEPFAETQEFTSDMIIGSAANPIDIHYPGEIPYDASFTSGWNWFSVNVLNADMTLANLLSCVSEGDYIKNQVASATFYDDYGWYGSLEALDPTNLYKLKAVTTCGASYMGMPVDVLNTHIGIVTGWNWIGYLPQDPLPIGDALLSLTLEEGDYIKNQTSSATFYDGYGWYGSLEDLLPTDGYMMKKLSADVLTYPESAPGSQSAKKSIVSKGIPVNFFDAHQFEFSGTVTAKVFVDGAVAGSTDNLLLAYVDNQLRGVARGIYFDPAKAYAYPIMIYSNLEEGETVTFRYYNAEKDQFYACEGDLVFINDMIEANAFESFELHVNSTVGMDDMAGVNEMSLKVYPNPFEDQLYIEYSLAERSRVRVEVYDMLGKVIELLDERTLNPGTYSSVWNANMHAEGTYFLKLTTETTSMMTKIVLLR